MTSRADFIAGNTRLRARLPSMLGPTDYSLLAELPREVAVERLGTSIYRPYLSAEGTDGRELLDATGGRLRDLLRGVRGLYDGTADLVVRVLLARHDLRDVLALLRGARTGRPGSERLAAVMGVGALDQHAAADVAASADGATAVHRLVAHRLPDPVTALALGAAWERYELTADPDEFESTIASTAIRGWTGRLTKIGRAAHPVLALLHAECDAANLLASLREPATEKPRLLPAGSVTEAALLAARRGDPVAVLAARPQWRDALTRHALDGDLLALEWSLETTIWRRAVRGLRRGDPLGADVPVGYVLAAECEARGVRVLLAGAASAYDVRELLVG